MRKLDSQPIDSSSSSSKAPNSASTKATNKFQKMKSKLEGARFRWINEKLYTTKGQDAYKLMQNDPEIFEDYHKGFSVQVKSWPSNPVDSIIRMITDKKNHKDLVVADLGCGEAKIAKTLNSSLVIHSFDLISNNPLVTACDISKVFLFIT
ncbi:25S rRNA-methyltransferase [Smittium culicis]|uniref:Ribosomal RNA-processing protein 8 n=1 Tax=Smittium culicis TaxID=133412 RepID=A0A1R1X5G4_9FUNG|nr:25S rRNA-methyltransferase [Smittium culicis]